MKVELTRDTGSDRGVCIVTREEQDPTFRNGGWADAESTFLYRVKQELIRQGHNVIKKRMWKDEHLVDERQQYIRTRNPGDSPSFCIWNTHWAVWDAGMEFNEHGRVELEVMYDIWE